MLQIEPQSKPKGGRIAQLMHASRHRFQLEMGEGQRKSKLIRGWKGLSLVKIHIQVFKYESTVTKFSKFKRFKINNYITLKLHVLALMRYFRFSSQIAKKQIRERIKVFMRKKNQQDFLKLVSVSLAEGLEECSCFIISKNNTQKHCGCFMDTGLID